MEPLVSIILPSYNHEKYISATIESVLTQSYRKIELVIIDDGSTDDTWRIITNYAEKDRRIRAYTQENVGVGASSQRGLELAQGEWVTFCGSDDTLPPKAIEHLVSKSPKCDLVIGEYELLKDCGERSYVQLPRTKDLPSLIYHSGAVWGKLFRKEYINRCRVCFPEMLLEEDTVFLSRFLIGKPRFAVSHASTYHYWEHEAGAVSLSRRLTPELFADRVKGKQIALNNMKEAGYMNAYERYFFMYADQLSKQICMMFDDPHREDAYSVFKDFVLSYDWCGRESRFIALTKVSKSAFENSAFSSYLGAQLSADRCDAVADMYALGQLGFRYIIKYAHQWCNYKLNRNR